MMMHNDDGDDDDYYYYYYYCGYYYYCYDYYHNCLQASETRVYLFGMISSRHGRNHSGGNENEVSWGQLTSVDISRWGFVSLSLWLSGCASVWNFSAC